MTKNALFLLLLMVPFFLTGCVIFVSPIDDFNNGFKEDVTNSADDSLSGDIHNIDAWVRQHLW